MPEVLRRPEAEADLDDLWLFIAQDDPVNADRFIDRIADTCNLLSALDREVIVPYANEQQAEWVGIQPGFP